MGRIAKWCLRLISVLVSAVVVWLAPAALAFSSYGSGTSATPYRIATCAQLQEISSAPAAYYVIVSNIDCTGATVVPVGNFTGTLDGRNHTISHITISGAGLFGLSTGATLKNLTLASGTIGTSGDSGSFVGWAINSTLSNLHSNLTVPGASSSWVGGLVGILDGGSLAGSSYSGTVTGGVDAGGLVGALNAGSPPVSDSYFDGTLTANGQNAGGLVGQSISGSITNSYSAGTIHVNGQTNVGGLVGSGDSGTIANSFAANVMTGTGSSVGAVYGFASNTSSRSGAYFDQYLANDHDTNSLTCAGTDQGSGACIAKNAGNAAPGYFKNTVAGLPLTAWDFTGAWSKTTIYPALQNVAAFSAPAGVPNGGDANGDGIADSYQANVADIKDAGGAWSTVQVPGTGLCTLDDTTSNLSSSVVADGSFTTKTSLDGFSVYCPTAGTTVTVSIIYPTAYTLNGLVLRYYNATTHAWSTVPGTTFSQVVIGGSPATKVSYTITDGGVFDQDGTANGVIVDPVAVGAVPVTAAPDTGFAARPSALMAVPLVLGSLLVAAACRRLAARAAK